MSRQHRQKSRNGKIKTHKTHTFPTTTHDPQYSINMEDNVVKLGDLAKVGQKFCPYAAVAKFPYKYMGKAHMQTASELYFAGGQFRARGWTL